MPRAAWLVIVIFGFGLAAFGLSGCAIYPGYGCDSNYGYAACNDNQLYAPDYFGPTAVTGWGCMTTTASMAISVMMMIEVIEQSFLRLNRTLLLF